MGEFVNILVPEFLLTTKEGKSSRFKEKSNRVHYGDVISTIETDEAMTEVTVFDRKDLC